MSGLIIAGWQQEYGGFSSYIAKDEDEEVNIIELKRTKKQ